MKLNNQEVLVCNCEDTIDIDGKALRNACAANPMNNTEGDISIARQLCRGGIEEFTRLAINTDKLLLLILFLVQKQLLEEALLHD